MTETKVFVGTATPGLEPHRAAVIEALETLSGKASLVILENRTNGPDHAGIIDAETIGHCDIFIGLVGPCFGGAPTETDKSYAQLEYEQANELGKTILVFATVEDFPVPHSVIKYEIPDGFAKQEAFRSSIPPSHQHGEFRTAEQLAQKIRRKIVEILGEQSEPPAGDGQAPGGTPSVESLIDHIFHRLGHHFPGRLQDRQDLTTWLENTDGPNFLVVEGIVGTGKSALGWVWAQTDVLDGPLNGIRAEAPVAADARPSRLLWWGFQNEGADFSRFLAWITEALDLRCTTSNADPVEALVERLRTEKVLLILDGFEREIIPGPPQQARPQQPRTTPSAAGPHRRYCYDPNADRFLKALIGTRLKGRVLILSRVSPCVSPTTQDAPWRKSLHGIAPEGAVFLFQRAAIAGKPQEIKDFCAEYDFHPLTLSLIIGWLTETPDLPKDIISVRRFLSEESSEKRELFDFIDLAITYLPESLLQILRTVSLYRSPVSLFDISEYNKVDNVGVTRDKVRSLVARGLLNIDRLHRFSMHPVIREHVYQSIPPAERKQEHEKIAIGLKRPEVAGHKPVPLKKVEDLDTKVEYHHHLFCAGKHTDALQYYRSFLAEQMYHRFSAYRRILACLEPYLAIPSTGGAPGLDGAERTFIYLQIGRAVECLGQPALASQYYEQGLEGPGAQLGNSPLRRVLARNLAGVETVLGRLKTASERLEREADRMSAPVREADAGLIAQHRGTIAAVLGKLQDADENHDKAGLIFESRSDRQSLAVLALERAEAALLFGDFGRANYEASEAGVLIEEQKARGLSIPREGVRYQRLRAEAMIMRSAVPERRLDDDLDNAKALLDKALPRCQKLRLFEEEPKILLALARWHHAQTPPAHAEAVKVALEALDLANRAEHRLLQADLNNLLAKIYLDKNDRTKAKDHARQAHERAKCEEGAYVYRSALDTAIALLKALDIWPPPGATVSDAAE